MDQLFVELPSFCVLAATSLVHFAERRVHGYNYAFIKAVDGEELIPRVMSSYYTWVYLLPWLAFLTSRLMPSSMRLNDHPLLGLGLVLSGTALSIGSMRALGRLWSKRCVFVPGMPRVNKGPYRILRHPEYMSRALQGLGFLFFFGTNPISFLIWAYSLWLLPRIIKTESRQLYELSLAPLQLHRGSSTVGSLE